MLNKIKNDSVFFFGIVFFLAILLMSVGFATINTITLEISGTMIADQPSGVYISEVTQGASSEASAVIQSYSSTTMHSLVTLSSGGSYITECVKIINNTDKIQEFKGVVYDNNYYSNQGITFEISNFNVGDRINPGESQDIYITFKFVNGTVAASNVLDSYLNFSMSDILTMAVNEINGSITYTGEEISGGAKVEVTDPESGYTIKYGTTKGNYTLTKMPGFVDVGTHTVYYQAAADNYETVEGDITITITKADVALTEPTAKELEYSGSAQELINAGLTEDGTLQYKLDTGTYDTAVPTATDVGTYTVYYKVIPDSNHNEYAEKSISVTIAKMTPTVTAPTAKSLTYNGSAQALVTAGTTNWGTIQYKLDSGTYSSSVPTATNAGTYKVYYKIAGDSNHNEVAEKSVSVTIAKRTPTVTAPTAKSLTYNGSAQTLINAGSTNYGTIQYKVGSGSYSTSLPTETNAGTYTVYYKVVGDSNNNDVAEKSLSVTIAKRTPTVAAPTAKSLTYNGSAQALVNAGSTNCGTLQYKLGSGSYSTSIPTATNAGTYTVYYKVVGDSNNNDVAEKSLSVTIAKAASTYTTEPTGKTVTYSGSAQALANAGSSSCGTVQYKLSGGSYSTSIPTATNVGTYTIYYKIVGDSNHNDSSEKTLSGVIEELITYSITYTTGYLPFTPSSSKTSYNKLTETFTLDTPSSTGFAFEGWYDNSSCTGTAITQITKGTTGNIQLWAKWTFIGYQRVSSITADRWYVLSPELSGSTTTILKNGTIWPGDGGTPDNHTTAPVVTVNGTSYIVTTDLSTIWRISEDDDWVIYDQNSQSLWANGEKYLKNGSESVNDKDRWEYDDRGFKNVYWDNTFNNYDYYLAYDGNYFDTWQRRKITYCVYAFIQTSFTQSY